MNQQVHRTATIIPELLSVGTQGLEIFEKPFQMVGFPQLESPIRIEAQQLSFNQTSYKAYTYHQKKLDKAIEFTLKDSLAPNPKYIQLSVLDRVGLANAFNNTSNKTIRNYIENDYNAKLVTSILITGNDVVTQQLLDAEEIYAIKMATNAIELQLIKDGVVINLINYAELYPFSYAVSGFCWGLDKRNRPELKAIVNGMDCPPNTKAKAYKLESPYNYKF